MLSFAVDEEATTGRGRIRGVYVLVVHDPTVEVRALCDALTAGFVVREVTTAFDALERLSGAPLACVVCIIGGSIHAEDFHTLVTRAAPEQSHRLLFIDHADSEAEFLKSSGAHWLPTTAEPEEVLALVRAVAAGGDSLEG
jgi:hypothetical protein